MPSASTDVTTILRLTTSQATFADYLAAIYLAGFSAEEFVVPKHLTCVLVTFDTVSCIAPKLYLFFEHIIGFAYFSIPSMPLEHWNYSGKDV